MRIADIASTPVRVAHPREPLAAAAGEMRRHGVGALVVVSPQDPLPRPLGILTDRDVLRAQIARATDLYCLTVEDAMTRDLLELPAGLGLAEALDALRRRGVRRAPVVGDAGELVGIVTLDDLLPAVARQLNDLAGITLAQSRGAAS